MESLRVNYWTEFQWVHCGSRVAVALRLGKFGNPGRGTFAVGNLHPKTSEVQQTKRSQCVCVVNYRL
jgi:hypothetical protein